MTADLEKIRAQLGASTPARARVTASFPRAQITAIVWNRQATTTGPLSPSFVPVPALDVFPGSVGRVVLTDRAGRYAGIVVTASAYAEELDSAAAIGPIAVARQIALSPDADVQQIMRAFDESETDDLAVIDADGKVIGTLSERFVRRRYTDEIEKAQRELFGE